jgi:hypothetical protein
MVNTLGSQFDWHPTGIKIYVKDGHLHVQSYETDIAIYAPNRWVRAKHGDSANWESLTL